MTDFEIVSYIQECTKYLSKIEALEYNKCKDFLTEMRLKDL